MTAADAVTARLIARLEGKQVEVLGERTVTGSVFALPDGSMAAGMASGPVWVPLGGDGTRVEDWAPLDLTLRAREDGTVAPVAHPGALVLSGATPQETPADAEVTVASVTTVTGETSSVQWEGPLPAPRLDGARAVYEDVRPGMDMVVDATASGFEQFFVLHEQPAEPAELTLPVVVTAEDATLAETAEGALELRDPAGEAVARMPEPMMWDATADADRLQPVAGEWRELDTQAPRTPPQALLDGEDDGKGTSRPLTPPTADVPGLDPDAPLEGPDAPAFLEQVPVERDVQQEAPGRVRMDLTPQEEFLTDPATTYPVVVDPEMEMVSGFDTSVQSNSGADLSNNPELMVGSWNGGQTITRSYMNFDARPLHRMQVINAQLYLYATHSFSCSPRNWQVANTTTASPATRWTNQPTWRGAAAVSSVTKGYSAGCPQGFTQVGVTDLVREWAAGASGDIAALGLKAENEADSYAWKRFAAAETGAGPWVWVHYNMPPDTPTNISLNDGTTNDGWTKQAAPTLQASVFDPDGGYGGGLVDGNFYLYNSSYTQIWKKASAPVANGAVASVKVPDGMLQNGQAYYFVVRASDHGVEGPQSGQVWFGVDTEVPHAPLVTSTAYPTLGWHGNANVAGAFNFSLPATDPDPRLKYEWALNDGAFQAVNAGAGILRPTTVQITPTAVGVHTLRVRVKDRAGNLSPVTTYRFGVGFGGIVKPDDGTRIVRSTRIFVEARKDLTYMRLQWRYGPDAPITPVPGDKVKENGSTAWDGDGTVWQPLPAPYNAGDDPYVAWDAGQMLNFVPGPVQLRAQFATNKAGDGAVDGQWVNFIIDPDASGAATASIGPGNVNLLTGDYRISATDADEFGLEIARTTSSRSSKEGFQAQGEALSATEQDASGVGAFVGSGVTLAAASDKKHSGAYSLKLTPNGTSADSFAAIRADAGGMRLGMQAGRHYRISGWVYASVPTATITSKGFNDRGFRMALFVKGADGKYNEPASSRTTSSAAPTAPNVWQQVSFDTYVPPGSTEAFVRLYNGYNNSTNHVVYWDELSVRELWAPFGAEWELGTVDQFTDSAYTKINTPNAHTAEVQFAGGGQVWFATADGGTTWAPEASGIGMELTRNGPNIFKVTELDGTTTEFHRSLGTNDFLVVATALPAAAGAAQPPVRQVYTQVPSGNGTTVINRLTKLIAPVEPGIEASACASDTPVAGCRLLVLDYADMSTARPTGDQTGDFPGQVKSITLKVPGATPNSIVLAQYKYNSAGQLKTVTDPRVPGRPVAYEYKDGRVTTLTPPGLKPWNVTYEQASTTSQTGAGDRIDSNGGRLNHVTRNALVKDSAKENVTSVVYDVPLSASEGGPYNLGAKKDLKTWGQLDAPVAATAIFPPDERSLAERPAATATATAPGAQGYDEAEVHYLNASGLEVNTASPKGPGASAHGFIDTTEYNKYGSPTRTLDATNRLLALDAASTHADTRKKALNLLGPLGLADRTSEDIANALDSRKGYSVDGLELLYERGPTQVLARDNDPQSVQALRPVTVNRYDEAPDAPIGGVKYHLVTTTLSGAVTPDTAVNTAGTYDNAALLDARATTYRYSPIDEADKLGGSSGWVHKQPTSVTVDAGQPTALTSTVLYDARGRVLRSSKPGAQDADAATALAATTLAVYYTAGPNDDPKCANQPVWAGQPCVTRTAGPVIKHDPARMSTDLPVKRVEGYNAYGSPTVTTDSAGTGAAQVVRTATTTYDAADRVVTVAMNATGPGAGAPMATLHTTYDPDTGEVTKNASVDANGAEQAVTKEYDDLGRLEKYTDAHGGWTTTTYDRYGQPHTVTDSIGTTRTYTYDRTLDHRGYVTKLSDSVAGDIVPTWGPDGQLESQTLPGGVRLTIGYDAARVPTSRTYTRVSDGAVIAWDKVLENHRGQWISHTSSIQGTSTYSYDRLGRLTGADHSPVGTGTCTSRRYGFDRHTNRTSLTTATAAAGAPCPGATGGTVTTSTYDSADRLVSTSSGNGQAWTYDALGRTTAMPTADGTGIATTGYFVNDLVASQEVPGVEKATWSLDPLHRFSAQNTFAWVPGVDGTGSWANPVEQVIHYDGDGDEPGWIVEDKTQPDEISRWVEGADGQTAVQTGKTGDRVLQLVNLHGDVVGTLPIADGATDVTIPGGQLASFDEFGIPIPMTGAATTNAPPARYGWLGAAQRSADTPAGVLLMGVRLYHPTTGRFLQVDPVAGGSANAYDYCNADPINCTDLGGTFTWKGLVKAVAVAGSVASWIPGPVGAAAGAVSAVAYAASGNTRMALTMTAVAAAQLVGAGPVARGGAALVARSASAARTAASAAARMSAQASGAVAKGAARAGTAARAAVSHFVSAVKKNNFVRIGRVTPSQPIRVSIGPAPKHWKNLPAWRRPLQPISFHMERARGGVTWNPTGASKRLWGTWG